MIIDYGMKESFINVILSLYRDVPNVLYVVLLLLFAISCLIIVWAKGIKHKVRNTGLILLVELVALLYCSTVVFRPINEKSEYCLKLFESYGSFNEGQYHVLADNVMNIAIFFPIGLLLGVSFRRVKWFQVFLTALLVSVSIELLQYALHKGFSEIDDVFHNVLGCMIGYGFYTLIKYGREKNYNRSVAVL